MSFDPITYAAVVAAGKSVVTRIQPVMFSTTTTAELDGWLKIRAMGAGGGGARGGSARGGNGGTVATTQWIAVKKGDSFTITIPAGGVGKTGTDGNGTNGGTLTVLRGVETILTIAGGLGGLNTDVAPLNNSDPVGADWFVLGGLAGNYSRSGGGGAMIAEGGISAGVGGSALASGGGGAIGDGGSVNFSGGGGALFDSVGIKGGAGFLSTETCVLRIGSDTAAAGGTVPVNNGGNNGGGGGSDVSGTGGNGGFGGGGGGGKYGGNGGFGGGGGGGQTAGGNGGFGGGGGGGPEAGGNGGQGFVTLEWREIMK